ncbi:MAG: septal ring lytic transglycosylase RlpA family protein, partial [Stellaceae bacterium]
MPRGSLTWAGVAASCLLLAACGSHPPAPSASAPSSSATVHSPGTYKVGKPYQIDGIWYYPREDWSYDETGIASWYGEQFHGRYTADGEIFNLNDMTAAHRTLPMPVVVRVTNLENGRSIKLRVNDRGPYARGRIIDVSRRAAQMLGFEGQGTAKVRVQ